MSSSWDDSLGGDLATAPGKATCGKVARKWTEAEVSALRAAVQRSGATEPELVNWQRVAESVPSRTAKQCREKWKVRAIAQSHCMRA
jgi:hypothetical protein